MTPTMNKTPAIVIFLLGATMALAGRNELGASDLASSSAAEAEPTPPSTLLTEQPRLGILGQPAPPLGVEQWFNLSDGQQEIDVTDLRGKVVYIYGFQSWCPGCHLYGFPTLQKLLKHYKDNDGVAFIAVQTVFEGFGTNTFDAAKRTADRYGLTIPVGHSGSPDAPSIMMRRCYRTGGTPWTVLVDRDGIVRYNDFHIQPERAVQFIDTLLKKDASPQPDMSQNAEVQTLPASRGGQDLVGMTMPDLRFERWIHTPDGRALATDNAVTLYRWWTVGCPFCVASLPAVEKLRKKHGPAGLKIVAVYHPKPPGRDLSVATLTQVLERLGYQGPIALDQDWSELNRLWLSTGRRRATSAAFLVDRNGVIRFVHPGPVFFPSDDLTNKSPNRDYELLDRAITALLRE